MVFLSRVMVALWVVLVVAVEVRGEDLARRVPRDAVVFVQWSGAGEVKGYGGSHLEGVVRDTGLREQIAKVVEKGLAEAAEKGEKEGAGARLALRAAELLWEHPTAVYFGGISMADAARPQPKLALISRVPEGEAAEVMEALNKAFAERTEEEKKTPAEAKRVGAFLLVTIGVADGVGALLEGDGKGAGSLAEERGYVDALKRVHAAPAVVAYMNGTRALGTVDELVAALGDNEARQRWPAMADITGIDALRHVVISGAFEGKQWGTRVFVGMDKDRWGVLGLLEHKPLDEAVIKRIPKSATWGGVVRFDGGRLYDDLRDGLLRTDANLAQQFDTTMGFVARFSGVNIREELLGAFGDTWVYYGTPDAVGNSLQGMTLINQVKDAKAAAKVMGVIQDGVVNRMARQNVRVAATMKATDGVEVNTLAMKEMSPSWALVGDMLVVSLSPQGVQSAVGRLKGGGESILERESFAGMWKEMGAGKGVQSFDFADLPETAGEVWVLLARANAEALARGEGEGLPVELPALEKVKPHLTAALTVDWSDGEGFHSRTVEAFPGSVVLGGKTFLINAGVAGARERARGQARNVRAAANLKAVGAAMHAYAADFKGEFPKRLGMLVEGGYATLDVFARQQRRGVPAEVAKGDAAQQGAWVDANAPYVLVMPGAKMAQIADPAKTPVAHERLDEAGAEGGVHVLYADGHVALVKRAEAEKLFGGKGEGAEKKE